MAGGEAPAGGSAGGGGAGFPWALAAAVLAVDIGIVAACLTLQGKSYEAPPSSPPDTSSVIGWVGTIGALVAFGNYGVLIKGAPALAAAEVDTMVFQLYLSSGVAAASFVIWAAAVEFDLATFKFSWLGFPFAAIWVGSMLCAYNAIRCVGYSVGPGMWCGVTIVVSFLWGSLIFRDDVKEPPLAAVGLALLAAGVAGCAASTSSLPDRLRRWREGYDAVPGVELPSPDGGGERPSWAAGAADAAAEAAPPPPGRLLLAAGVFWAACVGLLNGSLMFPARCFVHGCAAIDVDAYASSNSGGLKGDANVAFLPNVCLGIAAVTPVFFFVYFRAPGVLRPAPELHFRAAALPGVLTGCFWACGNFASFFATTYLGQTIGFPLTQCCVVLNGFWGILYFGEISGRYPVSVFVAAVAVVIGGAVMVGNFG